MNDEEKTNQFKVRCSGDDNSHPLIYLDIADNDKITCPYCGKIFIYAEQKDDN